MEEEDSGDAVGETLSVVAAPVEPTEMPTESRELRDEEEESMALLSLLLVLLLEVAALGDVEAAVGVTLSVVK